jgi:isoleucyl-tRNA synthetase
MHRRIAALGEELRFFTITSEAHVQPVSAQSVEALAEDSARSPAGVPAEAIPAMDVPGVWLSVQPSAAAKCVRCWHHRLDVGADATHPQLCARCVDNLAMPGESRRHC